MRVLYVFALSAMASVIQGGIAAGADPIRYLAVQSLGRSGPQQVPGWTFSRVDLNATVGGDYIYAGWQRGTSNPVTDVDFRAYNSAQRTNPRAQQGWEWIPQDLNAGAGGKWIYMFFKRGGSRPVYNLAFVVTSLSSPPAIPGYHSINVDLNSGAGGAYIWAYKTFNDDNALIQSAESEKDEFVRNGDSLINPDSEEETKD